jgi:hypothetical protein
LQPVSIIIWLEEMALQMRTVHLDFHNSPLLENIGSQFDPESFAQRLLEAKVESITCFAKCHHGMIYYYTKLPGRHPHLECDLLREQIAACHKVGIKVPIYISLGFDEEMAKLHLDWREVSAEGKLGGSAPLEAGWKKLCLNNDAYLSYVEEQIAELLSLFEVDGFFFDIIHQGECCCANCLVSMEEKGYNPEVSRERRAFAEKVLLRMKERLSSFIWERKDSAPVFYNAGHITPGIRSSLKFYSHLEIESLPTGGWGYDHFPKVARYARTLDLPYLGMTGRFHKSWAEYGGYKDPNALEYECLRAIAFGASCSIGDQLLPDGRLDPTAIKLISDIYETVAKYEPYFESAKSTSEIGVVMPELTEKRIDDALAGANRILGQAQYQFDLVDSHCDWSKYSVLILPDQIELSRKLAAKVEEYQKGGGKILASCHSGLCHGEFPAGWPLKYLGESEFHPDYLLPEKQWQSLGQMPFVMHEPAAEVESGARWLAERWRPFFQRSRRHFSNHFHTPPQGPMGRPGAVSWETGIYFAHPLFTIYRRHGSPIARKLVLAALKELLPEPLVVSNAPSTAQLLLNYQEKENRYGLYILHYVPERRSQLDLVEDSLPLVDLEIGLKISKPQRAYSLLDKRPAVEYKAGRTWVKIDKMVGHQLIVLEM